MGWLSGWSWAKEISLTGQTGAGTLYQVDLDIGASAGGDFHLEGHCTNFPQDIEVTDDDGTTLLDFKIEDLTADPLKMWVEVADDLGSNQTIWVYYGKSGATTNSDIDATFLFGDDFNASLDSNKWTTVQGAIATNAGNLEVLGAATRGLIEQNTTNYPAISIGVALEVQCYSTATAASSHFMAMRKAGDWSHRVDIFGIATLNDINIYTGDGGGYDTDTIYDVGLASSHRWMVEWYSGNAKYYKDGGLLTTHTTRVPSDALVATFYEGTTAGHNSYIDYLFIRKYNNPEPAFSSAGAEQSAPTVGHPTMKRWGGIPGMQYTGRRSW